MFALVLVSSLVLVAGVAQAGAIDFTQFALFSDLLEWLAQPDGGAFIVVSVFGAFALEKWAFWQGLSSNMKFFGSMIMAGLITISAGYVLNLPDVISFIQPIWSFLIKFMAVWSVTQVAHMKDGLRKIT
jgi:hypothetical protein